MRVALVGTGFMGRAHSNAWSQVKHFFDVPFDIDRALLCARDRARLEQMAATWGWREIATDWRAVIGRKDIDAVDIATPNALHGPIAIAAAESGKIVLCEKPLAISLDEARRMVDAARAVRTMLWHNYRRVPAISFARRLVEEERLGRIFHYRATYLQETGNDPTRPVNWKTRRAEAGPGVIGDLMSHVVDTALWLNGPIREITALSQTFVPGRDVEDAALALVRFENDSLGSFEATRYAVGWRNANMFSIHGSKGMLAFNLEDMNHLTFLDATEPRNLQGQRSVITTGPDHPYWRNFWKPGHVVGYEHTFIAALGDFLEAVANDKPFHPDFVDGLAIQTVLDAIERSSEDGRWTRVGGSLIADN